MASLQVEGSSTGLASGGGANEDGLDELRDQLRAKNLYSVLEICAEYTRTQGQEVSLDVLVELRKTDILELIDAINHDEKFPKNIGITQKIAFTNVIQKYVDQQQAAPAEPDNSKSDPTKHVWTPMYIGF